MKFIKILLKIDCVINILCGFIFSNCKGKLLGTPGVP